MPYTIVTKDGTDFAFHEYELPPLGPQEVQIQVTFAAPKHGTEAHLIRGSAHDLKRWDPDLRMFLPRPADAPARRRLSARSAISWSEPWAQSAPQ